jgi:hypothetical protein
MLLNLKISLRSRSLYINVFTLFALLLFRIDLFIVLSGCSVFVCIESENYINIPHNSFASSNTNKEKVGM